ncbi:hypothetical protein FE783_22085 [Paenibacillus mesophilus]|uniref:hypothetical protein n=1 Tax=Paenibacillus mesophilus TaxID=2582849 RepID=UPI00110D806B|nr:hypothetical protein [Paenibacillus mesophilus]TMV47299.1 hypothetical protein FE783_22085 [Paenibacillus mesophilus]
MENAKNDEQAVVVWKTSVSGDSGTSGTGVERGNVVPFGPNAAGTDSEAAVVSRSLPGRSGEAGSVIYVGSGFWARNAGGASSSASPRMAA